MGGTCNTHGKMRNEYKVLVRKFYGRRTEENWTQMKDSIEMVISETGFEDVEWMQVLRSTVLFAVPQLILDWQREYITLS